MNRLEREFVAQSISFLSEDFLPKIEAAVGKLTDEQIWWRANEESNSVGNLLLHLAGNVRQWIVSGVGGAPDSRQRQLEFERRGEISGAELLSNLRETIEEACGVLGKLQPESLLEKRLIQGRETAVSQAVYHVVTHFSMHAGQIIFVAKMFQGSLNFYDDANGLAIPRWKRQDENRVAF